ncbi:MAG TPA: histidine kinase, partial [Trueperaceae bacterium]|nr:histidine kinase [Trueperaceae bacterium]
RLPSRLLPWLLLLGALYLAAFFVAQLSVPARVRSAARLVAASAALAALGLSGPYITDAMFYLSALLLLAPPLVEEAVLSRGGGSLVTVAAGAGVALVVLVAILVTRATSLHEFALFGLVCYFIATATSAYAGSERERFEGAERYGALLSEYRGLKRSAAGSADAARAEERVEVARRLHDSVGHRLTSLLMQLEVARLHADGDEQRRRATELRRLAQLSLDETRAAVTALTDEELSGMPALLRLIHNLEVESAMQIEFTIGSGALSVELDRAPAVALYRAVQEALTNAMRHGSSRRASVSVEVPGGRLVRFEVSNEVTANRSVAPAAAASGRAGYRPGFGLTSMRERVEAAGGQLEVIDGGSQFLVRGTFPIDA